MTLGQLLVVIVFLGFLAGLLIPVTGRGPRPNPIRVQMEMADIEKAIVAYKANYSVLPMPVEAMRDAGLDFTYGTTGLKQQLSVSITNAGDGYQANNAAVMAILMARDKTPYNPQYIHNPQKKEFLNPRIAVADGKRGLGPQDGVYRDPWGNPYIISIDLNGDGWTRDAFYSRSKVSQVEPGKTNSLHRLMSLSGTGANDYSFNGPVMIWSFGPDGQANPEQRADEGVNEDNILSWR